MARFSFVSNFKRLTLARFLPLNFSGKSPWCSLVSSKFESFNLHNFKSKFCKLFLWEFMEQLFYQIIFERLHSYEVTLAKRCNKPLLQKSETEIFAQKWFIKNLFKVNENNNLSDLRINQIIYKLLILSKHL